MPDRIFVNQDLAAGQLTSDDGYSTLVLQGDGNLVLYRETGTAPWSTKTDSAVSAILKNDGTLDLFDDTGTNVFQSGPANLISNDYFLVVQDDGNVVIYGPNGVPAWATDTAILRSEVPGFLPSSSGFRFPNTYPSVPDVTIGSLKFGDASNGLCGGMVYATHDYFEAGYPIPINPPMNGFGPSSGNLFNYMMKRLMDSFDLGLPPPPRPPPPFITPLPPFGPGPWTYQHLMNPQLPDHETALSLAGGFYHGKAWVMINDAWPLIRANIDGGVLSPIGVIHVDTRDLSQMGINHQVLVYGYSLDGTYLILKIYDPNAPLDDDQWIALNIADPDHTTAVTSTMVLKIYCFFCPAYTYTPPPIAEGQLWHTIRHEDGSWQLAFGLIEAQAKTNPGLFNAIACAQRVDGSWDVVGLSGDGQMWHTVRMIDGSWQPEWDRIEDNEGNDPGPFSALACTGVGLSLHVVGISTNERQLWHTIRNPDGTWQNFYGLIEGEETNDPGVFTSIACAAGAGEVLHVAGLANSQMWHTIRNADGSWQPLFGLIEAQEQNDVGPFQLVACATGYAFDGLHVIGLQTGMMWHTIRHLDGSWQTDYLRIEDDESNDPGPFGAVACALVVDVMHVVGLDATGNLWHTILNADGSGNRFTARWRGRKRTSKSLLRPRLHRRRDVLARDRDRRGMIHERPRTA